MKRKNFGFTLAEVLITLAVIGIVAAVTLPNLMTSYQYNLLGVKLGKFLSNAEAASRAYVAANERIASAEDIAQFADSSFDYKDMTEVTAENMTNFVDLKDGTLVKFVFTNDGEDAETYPLRKYGTVKANLIFDPKISGLPSTIQHEYTFAMTETGYIYPSAADACNTALFQELNYKLKAADFAAGKPAAVCAGLDSGSDATEE